MKYPEIWIFHCCLPNIFKGSEKEISKQRKIVQLRINQNIDYKCNYHFR